MAFADAAAVKDNSDAEKYRSSYSLEDIKWASDLAKSARMAVWQDLENKFTQQQQAGANDPGQGPDNKRPSGLYVFVSFSMPAPLLKNYLADASRYNAIIVFKGLPEGSFSKFNKAIIDLIGDDEHLAKSVAMQIDDEAFAKYAINRVPTIILNKNDDNAWVSGNEEQLIYDKIIGNVGIKYALEQFSDSGSLSDMADEYLANNKHEEEKK